MTTTTTATKKKKKAKRKPPAERKFYKHCVSVYLSDAQLERMEQVIAGSKVPRRQGAVLRDCFERIYGE